MSHVQHRLVKNAKEINERGNDYYPRGGVIPFVDECGTRYYAFGISSDYRNVGDFGGHIEENETCIEGALREFAEESLGIFGFHDVSNCEVLESTKCKTFEILLPIEGPILPYTIKYYKYMRDAACSEKARAEVSSIVWLTSNQLQMLLHSNIINVGGIIVQPSFFPRLASLLKKHINTL